MSTAPIDTSLARAPHSNERYSLASSYADLASHRNKEQVASTHYLTQVSFLRTLIRALCITMAASESDREVPEALKPIEILSWSDQRKSAGLSNSEAVTLKSVEEVNTPSLTEVHVLAVDDSVLDRKMIERLLRTSSYKVTTVDSGNKALEVLGIEGSLGLQINISLIITDYCMPGMTGYELLKRIKETSALKEIPVVIMSSENVPNRIQRCLEEGAKEFIMKPVQLADVERLKSHIQSTCHIDQPSSLCNKRKFGSDGFEVQNPGRRPRLGELAVA
ncbi:hypothetical protein GOP47_0014468 [Adiantum capillus-veneris]|uniref:Response regulatory domain-containing protein n=1 Tax=Adiantum capillus-veneris TaxID=13818 RepID=A0A9D4ULI9_ADICA|nr:hypothetical protein GOP47_0014468 [Adiantum capillus-veneris]